MDGQLVTATSTSNGCFSEKIVAFDEFSMGLLVEDSKEDLIDLLVGIDDDKVCSMLSGVWMEDTSLLDSSTLIGYVFDELVDSSSSKIAVLSSLTISSECSFTDF